MNSQSHKAILCKAKSITRHIAVLGCCFSLTACASLGFGGPELDVDDTPTSAIGSASISLAGIAPSDWQVLTNKIAALDIAQLPKSKTQIAWNNPETGSKGEITSVSKHQSVMDEECRAFKTSMHSVTGVENVAGEICRPEGGDWKITGFASGSTA